MIRHLIFLLFALLTLSSCTKYQYVSLSSDLPKEEDTNKYFIDEDSIRVTFGLYGSGFSIMTRVHNFSSRDLYVDLASSTFVRNGKVLTNFVEDSEITIQSTERDYEFFEFDPDDSNYTSSGNISKSKTVVFVPPGTYASFTRRPFPVEYSKEIKRRSTSDSLSIDGKREVIKSYDISDEGDEYGVVIRLARNPDLKKMETFSAYFQEDKVYTLSKRIDSDSEIQSQNYYTSRTPVITRVVLGTGVLVSLAMFYALLENAGDTD